MANSQRRSGRLNNMVITLPENKPATCTPFGQESGSPTP
jgi:hypothetical protein